MMSPMLNHSRQTVSSHPSCAHQGVRSFAIVDDEDSIRLILCKILEDSGNFRCVGTYASGEEAIRGAPGMSPEVVLMDIRMPGISGIECMGLLKKTMPGLIVVLVTGLADPETMAEALAAGGDGYLTKPFTASQCLATVTFALRGQTPSSTGGGDACSRLTKQENEVMRCLAEGLLDKEIADQLCISSWSVRKHLRKIFPKLHVGNRTEAAREWRSQKEF